MLKGNTLHFINRVDENNCGDKFVCPLLYYYDYFKQYKIKRHDSRFIDFESIDETDVVIIGGGGLLNYAEFTNRAINKVLDTGATVIAWSPGFNTHTEFQKPFQTEIDFSRFAAITVRDFENDKGLPYLSDVTCKHPKLKEKFSIRRKFGIAKHKDFPIDDFDYDTITNESDIENILKFIGESEIIISNSFHMIYWSTLMGKKTICVNPFSPRFFSYKYKPEYYYPISDNFSKCVNNAKTYNILDECIQENDAFFEYVKQIIENKLTPISHEWSLYEHITQEALLHQKARELNFQKGDMLISQLYIDNGGGFREDQKLIAINNVYGDNIHTVHFDISKFQSVCALRFDPIEGKNCEIEILSAISGDSKIHPIAQASVKYGNLDRFLTTDPQYYIPIASPLSNSIEISFTRRILENYEAEHNIFSFIDALNHSVREQSFQINAANQKIEAANQMIEVANQVIEEQSAQIHHLSNHINDIYQSSSWRITAPLRKSVAFLKRILKGTKK